jgi:sporulation protein YlmC with PRC-barrel domain
MKTAAKSSFLVVAVVIAGMASAVQQTDQSQRPPVAGGAVIGVEVQEVAMIAEGYRISKMLNQAVYNDKNEKIGKLEELIVKPDGKLSWGIVDVGGFLGMGKHRVAIPVGQFTSMSPRIVLPGATKDALKQMPPFEYAKS